MTDRHDKTTEPAASPDTLNEAERERRAKRGDRGVPGRPLHREETAPGERGDGPYGDSEPGGRGDRPGA
jgi:hypothetical protein